MAIYFACIILLMLTINLLDAYYYYSHFTEVKTLKRFSHYISSTARTRSSKCLTTNHFERLCDTDASVQTSQVYHEASLNAHKCVCARTPTTHIHACLEEIHARGQHSLWMVEF